VICNAILIAWVASALRMELDVVMYLENIISYRLRGTAIAKDRRTPAASATEEYTANYNRAAHEATGCDGRLQ
jgi:hypothetical protein